MIMDGVNWDYIKWLHSREWEEWFAWYPVMAGGKWFWLTKVYRLRFENRYAHRKFDGVSKIELK